MSFLRDSAASAGALGAAWLSFDQIFATFKCTSSRQAALSSCTSLLVHLWKSSCANLLHHWRKKIKLSPPRFPPSPHPVVFLCPPSGPGSILVLSDQQCSHQCCFVLSFFIFFAKAHRMGHNQCHMWSVLLIKAADFANMTFSTFRLDLSHMSQDPSICNWDML